MSLSLVPTYLSLNVMFLQWDTRRQAGSTALFEWPDFISFSLRIQAPGSSSTSVFVLEETYVLSRSDGSF